MKRAAFLLLVAKRCLATQYLLSAAWEAAGQAKALFCMPQAKRRFAAVRCQAALGNESIGTAESGVFQTALTFNRRSQVKKQSHFVGVIFAFISLFILGVMPIISNSRPEAFQALSFAFFLSAWQLMASIVPFSAEWKYRNRGILDGSLSPLLRKRSIAIILMTGIVFGLSTFVYVLSVEKAGATNAAIAIQAYPIFAIFWETLFLNKRKTGPELLVTFILIATLYYIGTGGTWALEGGSVWFLLALGVPFLWSIAHVIIKEVIDKTPITPLQVTFFRVFVSTIFLAAAAMWALGPDVLWNDLSSAEFQKYAFIMGIVYYLELVVWFYAVRSIDVSLASSITTPWPALTLVLAIIFLGDEVHRYQVVSLILVAICVYSLLFLGARKNARA